MTEKKATISSVYNSQKIEKVDCSLVIAAVLKIKSS